MGGYHRPVCVEALLDPSIIRWRGGTDNSNLNFNCSYVLKLLYTPLVEAMHSGQNTYFYTVCRHIVILLMCILLGDYVTYILLIETHSSMYVSKLS